MKYSGKNKLPSAILYRTATCSVIECLIIQWIIITFFFILSLTSTVFDYFIDIVEINKNVERKRSTSQLFYLKKARGRHQLVNINNSSNQIVLPF